MGLFGIGDDNRMVIDVPARYAPILGLPYDPDDPSVFERSGKKINIQVCKGKGGKLSAEDELALSKGGTTAQQRRERKNAIGHSVPGCTKSCRRRLRNPRQ